MFRLKIENNDNKTLAHRIALRLKRSGKPLEVVQPNDQELWLIDDHEKADLFKPEVRYGTYSAGVSIDDLLEDLDFAVRRPAQTTH